MLMKISWLCQSAICHRDCICQYIHPKKRTSCMNTDKIKAFYARFINKTYIQDNQSTFYVQMSRTCKNVIQPTTLQPLLIIMQHLAENGCGRNFCQHCIVAFNCIRYLDRNDLSCAGDIHAGPLSLGTSQQINLHAKNGKQGNISQKNRLDIYIIVGWSVNVLTGGS